MQLPLPQLGGGHGSQRSAWQSKVKTVEGRKLVIKVPMYRFRFKTAIRPAGDSRK
jgi:hypothetical protein